MHGTMLWFNEVDDFGFISDEAGEQVRVQGSGFVDGLRPQGRCAGRAVTFSLTADEGEQKAEQVVLVPDVDARRARRRHHSGRMMRQ